jgi:hypothetical protein
MKFALTTGELAQSRQGRRKIAGRRKPPDQEPTPHTPAPEGRRPTDSNRT